MKDTKTNNCEGIVWSNPSSVSEGTAIYKHHGNPSTITENKYDWEATDANQKENYDDFPSGQWIITGVFYS